MGPAALLVERSAYLVLGHTLVVAVPHSVSALLLHTRTKVLSASRLTKYEDLFLSSPHISLKQYPSFNPASLLPIPSDDEPHDWEFLCTQLSKPQQVLQDVSLSNPDLALFVDGSCFCSSAGNLVAGFAVCSPFKPLLFGPLPDVHSAQIAELVALARAFQLAAGQSVAIYSDSRYACGIVHDFGQLWKLCGFLTAQGSPIKNATYVICWMLFTCPLRLHLVSTLLTRLPLMKLLWETH